MKQTTYTERLEILHKAALELAAAHHARKGVWSPFLEEKAKEALDKFQRLADRHRHLTAGEQLLLLR